jgi:toxin FitB
VNYLLDTCAVSELTRPAPEPALVSWLDTCDEDRLAISVLTVGEIEKGICRLPDSPKRDALTAWLHTDLMDRFAGRVLDVTSEVAIAWGRILGKGLRHGDRLPVVDALIAATALVHDCTVVTRNQPDLERCGASVLNPWKPPAPTTMGE